MKNFKKKDVTETSVSNNPSELKVEVSNKTVIKREKKRPSKQKFSSPKEIKKPKTVSLTDQSVIGSQDIKPSSDAEISSLSSFLTVGTEKKLVNGLSSYKGVNEIEANDGFLSSSASYSNLLQPTTFEEKEILKQALTRPEFQGKQIEPFVPRALDSDKVIEINDELGLQIDRLSISNVTNQLGLNPDAINLALNLNISGRIDQDFDKYYKSYSIERTSGTEATTSANVLSVLKNTEFNTSNKQSEEISIEKSPNPYSVVKGVIKFNLTQGVENHSYSADISSVNNKISFKKAFNNLTDFYANSPDFRLFHLMDDKLFKSLLDSPIQTATLIYILLDSIRLALWNANVIDAKTGFVDEGVRFFLNMNKNESKLFKMFIEDANEFLKLVPVNMNVVQAWKEHSDIGYLFDKDIVGEFNPLVLPQFILNFQGNDIPAFSSTDTSQVLRFRSTVDKTSVFANLSNLFSAFVSTIKNYIKPLKSSVNSLPSGRFSTLKNRTKSTPTKVTDVLSFASVSPAFISSFVLAFYMSETLTGDPFSLLKAYSLQTLSFWEHLQRGKVFEGTGFEFVQVSDIDTKNFRIRDDVKKSSLGVYLEDLYLDRDDYRKIPFYELKSLNDNRKQKTQLIHVYSDLDKVTVQNHTKFFLVDKGLAASSYALKSIFLMDSVIHPYLIHDFDDGVQILGGAIQAVSMRTYNCTFSKDSNKELMMVPTSFLWSGFKARELEKVMRIKFDIKKPVFLVKNHFESKRRPSNGVTVSGSSVLVDAADIEFFWNHFDQVHNLSNLPIFNNQFKFNNSLIPDALQNLWRAPGFLKIYEFENSYIRDVFSARDVQSYRRVGADFISREDIKL